MTDRVISPLSGERSTSDFMTSFHDLHSVLGSMFATVGSSWGSSSRVANGRPVVQFATLMTYNPENSAYQALLLYLGLKPN